MDNAKYAALWSNCVMNMSTVNVRFCEKIAIFKFGAKGALDPKFGPGVQIVSKMNAEVQASP